MINEKLKLNDVITIEIKKTGINGEGIGYYEKLAVFVDDTLPGEIVDVKITEIYDTRIVGQIEDIKVKSPDRLEVLYPDYALCGAYGMQHVTYKKALELKRDVIVNALNRYVKQKIKYSLIKPTVGMEEPFGYRNKVSLPIRKIGGLNKVGLYKTGGTEFIPVNDTPVQHPKINEMLQYLETLLDEYKFDAYIQKEKSGYIKSIVMRRSYSTGETQLSFLLMKKYDKISEVVSKLVEKYPEIVSVFAYYTDNYKEQIFFTTQYEKIFGKDTINEKMNNQTFSLYPEAFWQLNTQMADKFYSKMVELAKPTKEDIVIDAYAGIAPVSHYFYKEVEKVYAIEVDQRSIQSAKLSLKRNNIKNVDIMQSDFFKALKQLGDKKIDIIVFDPPRTGLGYQTIKEVLKFMPRKIVYGSCNPSTLAKDLEELLKYYDLKEIVPMDMFPYTPLVESVTLLELKKA
ncbi:23S rRNA (Uracil-5-)-methyltransferase RumA [Alteracholeplasma palmae J233]|uniref:23S rRNA (Uracil-5-)-methyltransferase RumA n=1 Tax=Alteracholeplasma palmae (strain ATCC 49389 / J233) TaxID=1318466 RepID=U4KLD2_ALTPJ|nr:23S rRNA (uracil(1939)-C(5))-methyltransferase RlmD [Alteracholeplasma palmae]CCV64622.1 23S rRNA (Uracil-5-)-methyltransferase RumA [Alteracholeplasma palmae J233]